MKPLRRPSLPKASSRGMRVAIVALTAAVAGFIALRASVTHRTASANSAVQPYILKTVAFTFRYNPAGELLNRTTIARRSDGAVALLTTAGGPV